MAEQISKKHRHQVIMSSNALIMVTRATMAGTLVIAPKSVDSITLMPRERT